MQRGKFLLALGVLAVVLAISRIAGGVEPPGIVYESEAISTPETAWELNCRTANKWMLWTKEDDIERKRSGGAVLAGPVVEAYRKAPEEGAPPLHSVVDDLEGGLYRVYVSAPGGRPLAYSRDGKEWFKHVGSELFLGLYDTGDGPFELWVDDRYAHPKGNPGPGYYDYVRFVPVPPSAKYVERYSPWHGLDKWVTQEAGGYAVPALDTQQWVGFEDGGDCLKGEKPGDAFSHALDRTGTFYAAVLMNDDVDGIEQLVASLNGEPVGCIVGDDAKGGSALYGFTQPMEVKAGDTLTFTCQTPVGYYRVYTLYFAPEPIVPPPPSIQHVEAWSPEPGAVDLCWTTTTCVETGTVEYGVEDFAHATEPETYRGRNHRVRLRGLDPDQEYQARVETEHEGEPVVLEGIRFRPAPKTAPPTQAQTIELTVPEPTDHARQGRPATTGIPFAKGMLARTGDLRLFDGENRPIPLEAKCFSRWRDGSVKWATLSFLADTALDAPRRYRLEARPAWDVAAALAGETVTLEETDDAWRITTGALAFDIGKKTPALFHNVGFDRSGDGVVSDDERVHAEPLGANLELEAGDGALFTCGQPEPGSFTLEVNGPVRAVLKWSGPLVTPDGERGWWYLIRLTLWKGMPAFGINVSVCHDAPKPDYRPLAALALRVPLDASADVRGAFDGGALEPVPDADGLWILQDRENHYRMRMAEGATEGERSLGVATASDDRTRVTVLTRDFWQTYPKGYAIKPDGVHVQLLPPLTRDTYSAQADPQWFYRLYAWFKDGHYMFRAGQLTQHNVYVHYAAPDSPQDACQGAAAPWLPLLPQAPPAYLCATGVLGRPLFPRTEGIWDSYEQYFEASYRDFEQDRERRRTYGWMHYGDWYGERYCNYGNSEYDTAWVMALQWLRTGDRRYFDRGLQMARHHSTVDTRHGPFTEDSRCLVWTHCFNHAGTCLSVEELNIPPDDEDGQRYLERFAGMLRGAMDPQGHIYQQGNWLYAALTGDPWFRHVAERVCSNQAKTLTPAFNFGIERSGGWPVINACAAYGFSGNPHYLNAARLMVERALQRQDPETGGWPHTPPRSETAGVRVWGGKAFAVGILTHGLLRYLEQEPDDRPDVRRMLVRGADWLMNEAWNPAKGFRYISNAPNCRNSGHRGITCLLNAEIIAFAYDETGDRKYLEFWKEMMKGMFDSPCSGMGKSFTQCMRQTIFGLDRIRHAGIVEAPAPP